MTRTQTVLRGRHRTRRSQRGDGGLQQRRDSRHALAAEPDVPELCRTREQHHRRIPIGRHQRLDATAVVRLARGPVHGTRYAYPGLALPGCRPPDRQFSHAGAFHAHGTAGVDGVDLCLSHEIVDRRNAHERRGARHRLG